MDPFTDNQQIEETEGFDAYDQEPDCDDSDDGYALASAGWGTDEDYGGACDY